MIHSVVLVVESWIRHFSLCRHEVPGSSNQVHLNSLWYIQLQSGISISHTSKCSNFYHKKSLFLFLRWPLSVNLQKGCGYHLDLFVVGVMLGVCSVMGLPWFVAATVLSISHVNSLKLESECSAPGEQPKFLGIREQRFTGLMIFTLMGCSVFMTSVLKVRDSPDSPPGKKHL